MWIAKPVGLLSSAEREAWIRVAEVRNRRTGELFPLSQTLTWAAGIAAVSGKAYVVFEPEQNVGGLVFSTILPSGAQRGTHFECVNGPLLDWDDEKLVAQQLATFAMGVSKLAEPGRVPYPFRSLKLRPRWEKKFTAQRLSLLPMEPREIDQVATLRVPIQATLRAQQDRLHTRLRRTLLHTSRARAETRWRSVGDEELQSFVPKMREFGEKRGFKVPPLEWFRGLCLDRALLAQESISFWLGSSRVAEGLLEGEILVCVQGAEAHYLFGWERRAAGMRAALSPAASCQWEALSRFVESEIKTYDLNGYVVDASREHSYAGVCRFKEQWGGDVVEYSVPEFLIE